MADIIVVVDENGIEVASSTNNTPIEVTAVAEPDIVVIPDYGYTGLAVDVTATPTDVIVTPPIFAPTIYESFGVTDLYIMVIDPETLALWQHKLNDLSDIVDDLIIKCTALEALINNILDSINTTNVDINALQAQLDALELKVTGFRTDYLALLAQVEANTNKLSVFDIDLDNLNNLIINLNDSWASLDGRITANASSILDIGVSITELNDGINANAHSITTLGVNVSDLQQGLAANSNAIDSLNTDVTTSHNSIIANSSHIISLDSSIEDLDGRVEVNATAHEALFSQVSEINGNFEALVAQTSELVAEIPSTFCPIFAWEFIEDLEGWVAGGSATLAWAVQTARVSGDGFISRTLDTPVDGEVNPTVTLRWQTEVEATVYIGEIWYKYTGGPSTWTVGGSFFHIYGYSKYRQSTVDCDWGTKEITAIAIKFAEGGTFALDSIGIGYKSSFGAMAYIRHQAVAWVTEDEAFAQEINDMHTQIGANTGNITTNATAIATIEGVTTTWSLALDANNVVTGLYLTASDKENNIVSDFKIIANTFRVYGNGADHAVFETYSVNGTEYVKLINAKIATDISSTNYDGTAHTGWIIKQNGVAEFNGITIYNAAGTVILSSASGLNTSGLVDDIKDDMAKALGSDPNVTSNDFVTHMQNALNDGIEANTVITVQQMLLGQSWTDQAFINTAHINNLSVGTSKIAYGATSDTLSLQDEPLSTSTVTVLPYVQSEGQKVAFTIYINGSFYNSAADGIGDISISLYRYDYVSNTYESDPIHTFKLYVRSGPGDYSAETPSWPRGFNSVTGVYVDYTPPSSADISYIDYDDKYKIVMQPATYCRIDDYSMLINGVKR